ncbi:MAG: phosphomannomutase/phosphoglucomutase [Actinobacteria bacterium]|nr:phosphomannomutase/phosphoglucomutase [Actinomycetota bacterium]
MSDLSGIFKAYDIRGLVPEELDARKARAIGWAFARLCISEASRNSGSSVIPQSSRNYDSPDSLVAPDGTVSAGNHNVPDAIVVCRDMRESGRELVKEFAEGAMAAGMSIKDAGMTSTDMAYFISGDLNLPAAIFTASHNPAAYNGIKLCYSGARPVGQETGLAELMQMATDVLDTGDYLAGPAPGTDSDSIDMLQNYVEHVLSFIDISTLRSMVVVADTANGMGGLVVPEVFSRLPFEYHILYPELDGNFPNHPADPIQEKNLSDLKRAVLDKGADVGLAFDGDADRVFLVDENARPVSGSLTTALVASSMLTKFPGATILYNIICSKVVPETISSMGGKPIRTRVGHSFIKQVMAETGALFGGEHSGHYYFRDNYRADSGMIAALMVLELMSRSGKPLSELVKPLQRYNASGEINTVVDDPAHVVAGVADRLVKQGVYCDMTDGLTVDYGSWWFNLRPSNTEPLLRLNVEASHEIDLDTCIHEVEDLIDEVNDAR